MSKRKSCWELTRPLKHSRLILEYPERNKCEGCGSKKHVIIHHLDENRMNNKKENIAVICRSCHAIVHKISSRLPKDGGWSKRRGG